jgi:hypothetical protein
METGDEGTFGELVTDSGFSCKTGELPWRENLPNESSIPLGKYLCTWRESSRHGMCYHIEGVPGRSGVEIHSANFMGDKSKGFRCELLGCIAPGLDVGSLNGQKAVVFSREARTGLEDDLARETFELTIV